MLPFAATVAALGVATYLATSIMLNHHLDARIESTMAALQSSYRSGGLPRLVADVNARLRIHRSSSLYYLVLGPHGTQLAGHLPSVPTRAGWSDMNFVENESDNDMGRLRVLFASGAGGVRLAVAADLGQLEGTQEAIFDSFLSAFGAVVLLGTVGGIALSLALLKRVETIRQTAEAIIAGDLSERVPLQGSADDLDRLPQTLNHMLDRIAELMESLRQVSTDVAHDLKTPLARLRQRFETLQRQVQSAEDYNAAVEAAIGYVDEILATFGALLRIAQIEAGTRRAGRRGCRPDVNWADHSGHSYLGRS